MNLEKQNSLVLPRKIAPKPKVPQRGRRGEAAFVLMELNGEEEPTLSSGSIRRGGRTLRLCKLVTHLRVKPIDQNVGDGVFGIKTLEVDESQAEEEEEEEGAALVCRRVKCDGLCWHLSAFWSAQIKD